MMMMVVITECEADFGMFNLAQCVFPRQSIEYTLEEWANGRLWKKTNVEPNAQPKTVECN